MNFTRTIFTLFLIAVAGCTTSCGQRQASVTTGAEVLLRDHLEELRDQRVGLVMNPTARVDGVHMLDALLERGINVSALFAPEHGFRGDAGAGEIIEDGVDQATGLPVFSLYGDTRKPTAEMLEKVDLLIFDMQDVGARFYTYNATLGNIIEAAAASQVPVWILDRPNPAGGDYVSGWMLQEEHTSFVGAYPIPMVHGMTLGELAKMIVGESWISFDQEPEVRIIEMEGWERSMIWPDTGLEWVPPSPNLPSFEHAFVYLGTVLFEGTDMSEGRGTPDPFLTLGAPTAKLTNKQINDLRSGFPSVSFDKYKFRPRPIPGKAPNPKHEGELCYGVNLNVLKIRNLEPVNLGVALLSVFMEHAQDISVNDFMPKLTGIANEELMKQISDRSYLEEWQKTAQNFKKDRKEYLLY